MLLIIMLFSSKSWRKVSGGVCDVSLIIFDKKLHAKYFQITQNYGSSEHQQCHIPTSSVSHWENQVMKKQKFS